MPGQAVRLRPTDTRLTNKQPYLHLVVVVIIFLVLQIAVLQGPFLGLTHRVRPSVTTNAASSNRAITCKQQVRLAYFRRFTYLLICASLQDAASNRPETVVRQYA